jgi:hypothetical protein
MLADVNAIGQPSTSGPPLPPGLRPLPPVAVPFGAPPVVGISESQISEHLTNFALPADVVIRTPTGNIPSSTWNATVGQKLRNVPVEIATLPPTILSLVGNPVLTNCLAAYFDAGGIESFEVSANGEIETAWIGELQQQRYVALSQLHLANDPDPWPIKYVNQRPLYALNRQRLGLLRIWNSQQK